MKLVDRAATGVITFGGVFIIVSVLVILVFIVAEALPLFRRRRAEKLATLALAVARRSVEPPGAPSALGVDEYQKYVYDGRARRAGSSSPRSPTARGTGELAIPGLEGGLRHRRPSAA